MRANERAASRRVVEFHVADERPIVEHVRRGVEVERRPRPTAKHRHDRFGANVGDEQLAASILGVGTVVSASCTVRGGPCHLPSFAPPQCSPPAISCGTIAKSCHCAVGRELHAFALMRLTGAVDELHAHARRVPPSVSCETRSRRSRPTPAIRRFMATYAPPPVKSPASFNARRAGRRFVGDDGERTLRTLELRAVREPPVVRSVGDLARAESTRLAPHPATAVGRSTTSAVADPERADSSSCRSCRAASRGRRRPVPVAVFRAAPRFVLRDRRDRVGLAAIGEELFQRQHDLCHSSVASVFTTI